MFKVILFLGILLWFLSIQLSKIDIWLWSLRFKVIVFLAIQLWMVEQNCKTGK